MRNHSIVGWVSLSLGITSVILCYVAGVEAYGFYLGIISLIFGLIVRFAAKDNFGVAGCALGFTAVYLSLSMYSL